MVIFGREYGKGGKWGPFERVDEPMNLEEWMAYHGSEVSREWSEIPEDDRPELMDLMEKKHKAYVEQVREVGS